MVQNCHIPEPQMSSFNNHTTVFSFLNMHITGHKDNAEQDYSSFGLVF